MSASTQKKNSCGITGLNGVGSLDDFRLGNGIAYFYLFPQSSYETASVF